MLHSVLCVFSFILFVLSSFKCSKSSWQASSSSYSLYNQCSIVPRVSNRVGFAVLVHSSSVTMSDRNVAIINNLEFYYYNATSIRCKLDEFNSHFSGSETDIIAVTESWLNDTVYDGEILPELQYNVFRKDRDLQQANKDDGGGVMCAVKSHLPAMRREDLETDAEILWVQIPQSKKKSIFIATVYLHNANIASLELIEDSIAKVTLLSKPNDSIIVFGYFNLRGIPWILSLN